MNFSRLSSIVVLSAVVSACSTSTPSLPPAGSAANSAQTATSMDSWHRALAQNRLPSAGCFKATYPSTRWTQIACSTPPHLWYPVRPARLRAEKMQIVGNGHDFTEDTTPKLISASTGAFPKVKGVTSVKTVGGGLDGLNSYTLQLNSYFFQTVACGSLKNCEGWEQFVFENPPGAGRAQLFIQDWLVATAGSFSSCPPGKGWQNVGIGCVQNSPTSVAIPNVSITNLGQLIETGSAASTGDSVFLSVGTTEFGMQNIQSDGITDLSAHWMGAEFNVIGNAGGSIAEFNSGSKITVSLEADDGVLTKPTCPANSGTTGESNNLFFVRAPLRPVKLQFPSIEFTMASTATGTVSCDTVKGTGI